MSRQQDMRPLYDIDRPGPPVDSMSNLKRDIEGVLEKLVDEVTAGDGEALLAGELTFVETATTQIINLIESVADEIIGADSTPEQDSWHTANNKLRAEQRDIKSKLIGGE